MKNLNQKMMTAMAIFCLLLSAQMSNAQSWTWTSPAGWIGYTDNVTTSAGASLA